jgi:hypothetical protein
MASRHRPPPLGTPVAPSPAWAPACAPQRPAGGAAAGARERVMGVPPYEDFCNTHRPHRALSQAAPLRPLPDGITDLDHFRVQRRDRAGA